VLPSLLRGMLIFNNTGPHDAANFNRYLVKCTMVNTGSSQSCWQQEREEEAITINVLPAQWVENAGGLSFRICRDRPLGRMFRVYMDSTGVDPLFNAFYYGNQWLNANLSATQQGIGDLASILFVSYQEVITDEMWTDLLFSTMITLTNSAYDNDVVASHIQNAVDRGYAETTLAVEPVPLYKTLRVIESCRAGEYFEQAIYNSAVDGYRVDEAEVLVEVETLQRSSMQVQWALFRRLVDGGEQVFVLWLNHNLMGMVRCLHDQAQILDRGIDVVAMYPMMIVRAILRFIAHGCDDIVRNAGNMRLLSSQFGVDSANVVACMERVFSWCEGPFGFQDKLTEVRAAWDVANGFVTRIRGVFCPVRIVEGDPICVICWDPLFVDGAGHIGALDCGHVMHEGCVNQFCAA
jgi:hypothetical protein